LVRRREPLAASISSDAVLDRSIDRPASVGRSVDRRFVEDNRLGVDQLSSTNRLLTRSGDWCSDVVRARPRSSDSGGHAIIG
jgi:hypothetical protein